MAEYTINKFTYGGNTYKLKDSVSGYITSQTDEKLKVAEVTSTTQYYPIVGTGTTAATRQYDTTGFKYKGTTGTTSAVGSALLELGNSTASGTAGNKQGQLVIYGTNAKKATITLAAPTADIALALPTSGGTLALSSQIPTIPTNISSFTNDSGYITSSDIPEGAAASTTTPKMDGTAATGTELAFARGDHVHPTDTSRAATGHTHATTIATSTGTNQITLAHGGKYSITAGGTSYIFTMPASGNAASNVTGISISDHGTTSVGSASAWSAGTASTWAFEDIACDDITNWSAGSGSFTSGTFNGGSGSFTQGTFNGGSGSLTFTMDTTDTKKLKIAHTHTAATHGTDSHTHTPATHGADSHAHTAPTLSYTARTVSSKKSGANSTVPSLTITSTTVVNGKTHSITDPGHTHTVS